MYSQQDEEKYILEALEGITGTFLDIGAWHPTDKSNTRRLIELGWSGVLIEPSPGPFINLMRACVKCGHVPDERYGERVAERCQKFREDTGLCGGERYGFCDRLTLVLAAVSCGRGLGKLYATDDALTTSLSEHRDAWIRGGGASFYGSFLVPVLTWPDLSFHLDAYHCDFVSIDAEGTSADIFLSMLKSAIYPKCICVEHDGRQAAISEALKTRSIKYTVAHENNTNLILVRK